MTTPTRTRPPRAPYRIEVVVENRPDPVRLAQAQAALIRRYERLLAEEAETRAREDEPR